MRYRMNRRPTYEQPLSERWRMINRAPAQTMFALASLCSACSQPVMVAAKCVR